MKMSSFTTCWRLIEKSFENAANYLCGLSDHQRDYIQRRIKIRPELQFIDWSLLIFYFIETVGVLDLSQHLYLD